MDMSRAPSLSSFGSSSSSSSVVVGGHGSSMKEASVDEAFYRKKMALFLTSFCLFLAKCLGFLIRFIAKHLFGIGIGNDGLSREKVGNDHRREENKASLANEARSLVPILEKKTMMESDIKNGDTSEEDKEDYGFTFKFQYQIPNFPAEFCKPEPLMQEVSEKKSLPTTTTSLPSYHFLPEKDLGGFIAYPEAKTFLIQESSNHDNHLFSTEDINSLSVNNYGEENIEANKCCTSHMISKLPDTPNKDSLGSETTKEVANANANLLIKRPPETRNEELLESETTKEKLADANASSLVEGNTNLGLSLDGLLSCDLDTKSPIYSGASSVIDHVLVSEHVKTADLKLGISSSSFKYGSAKHAKEDLISSQSSTIDEKLQHPLKKERTIGYDTKLGKKIANEDLVGSRSSIIYEKLQVQKPLKEEGSKGSDSNKSGKTVATEDLVGTQSTIIYKKSQHKKPLKQEKIKYSGTKISGKTRREIGAKFMAEEYYGFNSDWESASESDGYSVKGLIVESDDKENAGTKLGNHSRLSAMNAKPDIVTESEVKRLDEIYIQPTVKNVRQRSNKPIKQKKIEVSGNKLSTQFSLDKLSTQFQKDNVASVLIEELFGSNSDIESLSESDGYSVKDLVVDSEGFLSERDFDGSEVLTTTEDAINANARKVELQNDIRISREAQLRYLQRCAALSDSSDDKFVYTDKHSKSMEHHLDDFSKNLNLDENLSVNDSCNPGTERNKLNEVTGNSEVRKFDQTKYPDSSIQQMDFTDSSDDDLVYPLKNNFTYMKSFDELVNQDIETGDFEEKEAEDVKFGYETRDARINEVIGSNEIGKFYQVHILESSLQPLELTDSSGDELVYQIKNNFTSMKSFDDLINEDAENDDFDEKESENVKVDAYSDVVPRPSSVEGDSVSLIDANDQVESKDDSETKAQDHSIQKSKGKQLDLDDEDYDELESLWEHHDLVEQLRMELKRVKAVGLPTILEESESPKTVEDLKPWKIDEKFMHEDPMDELQKFYKSYNEKMRKLDILNYQKLYALGFLQQKDPLQSMVLQKPLIPTIASILSHNFRPVRGNSSTDQSKSFIKELRDELELVYVGQTCLSWEFLRWQYEKTRELPESDNYRDHHYNHVAGGFQQFQVVLQRFIENESFQGPRLLNYVKNRCILKNLLQVPVIKVDSLKDKREDQQKGNCIITREMLEDIIEESIRIFWEFVKADKDETPGILKALKATYSQLQDPSDYEIMSNIQSDLQKKYKKIKDILRTGNCIIKKFKKAKEDRSNQDLFFSQVDLKLVARVLRMSRITTDQLVWCHKKLDRVMIVDRKIYRESSFLQFPC